MSTPSLGAPAPHFSVPSNPIRLNQNTTGTEGLMLTWDEGYLPDTYVAGSTPPSGSNLDMTLRLETPQNGQLSTLRIASGSPNNTFTNQNANKFITVTWVGGTYAILTDPIDEIKNFADGAIINSGDIFEYEAGGLGINLSQWFLDVDLEGVPYPFDFNYNACLLYTSPSPRD